VEGAGQGIAAARGGQAAEQGPSSTGTNGEGCGSRAECSSKSAKTAWGQRQEHRVHEGRKATGKQRRDECAEEEAAEGSQRKKGIIGVSPSATWQFSAVGEQFVAEQRPSEKAYWVPSHPRTRTCGSAASGGGGRKEERVGSSGRDQAVLFQHLDRINIQIISNIMYAT
jgi:hypothetical protein